MTKEQSVDASGSPQQERKNDGDTADLNRLLPQHQELEKHKSAVDLHKAHNLSYSDELWWRAGLHARAHGNVIITSSDVQKAAAEMRQAKPKVSWRSRFGIIATAIINAGLSVFVTALFGPVNCMIIISMSLVVSGLLLLLLVRPQT